MHTPITMINEMVNTKVNRQGSKLNLTPSDHSARSRLGFALTNGLALIGVALLLIGCANSKTIETPMDSQHTTPKEMTSGRTTVANSNFSQRTMNSQSLTSQQISGVVLGEDGKTPLSGATVYIANYQANDFSAPHKRMINNLSLHSSTTSVAPCAKPKEAFVAMACSREDGSFVLTMPQINQLPLPLIFFKGEQKGEIAIDLNDLGTNIGKVAFNFPEPPRSNVAIVLDLFNPYDDLRNQLKTTQFKAETAFLDFTKQLSEVFNIDDSKADISFPDLQSLFEDKDSDGKPDIFNYDTVYINSRNQSDIAKLEKSQKQALLKYISRGGQLYITEWTIELPEIPLDQYI